MLTVNTIWKRCILRLICRWIPLVTYRSVDACGRHLQGLRRSLQLAVNGATLMRLSYEYLLLNSRQFSIFGRISAISSGKCKFVNCLLKNCVKNFCIRGVQKFSCQNKTWLFKDDFKSNKPKTSIFEIACATDVFFIDTFERCKDK